MRYIGLMHKASFLALTVGGLAAMPAHAENFSYAGFGDTTGLQINGSAAVTDTGARDVLRLTPAVQAMGGSVFNTQAIGLSSAYSFSTRFTFNIGNNNVNEYGEIGADGIAFVMQTVSNSVGGAGGGLGYAGINPSLAVEFDTYNNRGFDPAPVTPGSLTDGDHIAVMLNGDPLTHWAYATTSPTLELSSGIDITAFIDYDGAANMLEVRWSTDGSRPGAAGISYGIDLASLFSTDQVYVGFTGATGADYSTQDIVDWAFTDTYDPITTPPTGTVPVGSTGAVPEPATWAMMIAGFGLTGAAMRRRKGAATAAA